MKNNNSKPRIFLITGPTAIGKSMVAKLLCKRFNKCVRLDIDRVKHFVESGFIYDSSAIGKKQWELCTNNIIALVKNYLLSGYSVVIEGVIMGQSNYAKILKEFSKCESILLVSSEKELLKRNLQRPERAQMSKKDIQEHQKYFSGKFFKKFDMVDTGGKSVERAVDDILKNV